MGDSIHVGPGDKVRVELQNHQSTVGIFLARAANHSQMESRGFLRGEPSAQGIRVRPELIGLFQDRVPGQKVREKCQVSASLCA